MPNNLPSKHIEDYQKLDADSIVELWEAQPLGGGIIRFKANENLTWLGYEYTGLPLKFDGSQNSADEKASRPNLVLGQQNSLFTPFLYQGALDGAVLRKYKVLGTDITNDTDIKVVETWLISQVVSYTPDGVTLKLRRLSDGPSFVVPARQYIQPEFPNVSF